MKRLFWVDNLKALIILLITAMAFLTRLVFPIGSDVLNLQIGFFPAYIVMFFVGVTGYRQGIFDKIDLRMGLRWLVISLAIGIPMWILIMFFGGPLDGSMLIAGGMNWPAFLYAFWESFFCVTFIVSLIGIFREKVNRRSRLQRFLSENAFTVFVFHAPVLIGISVILKGLEMHPVLKFFMVWFLAVSASFIISWLIRRVKLFGKIFS